MCYGVDVDPDILVAYAIDQRVALYRDDSPTCSEYEIDDDDDKECHDADEGDPQQRSEAEYNECHTKDDVRGKEGENDTKNDEVPLRSDKAVSCTSGLGEASSSEGKGSDILGHAKDEGEDGGICAPEDSSSESDSELESEDDSDDEFAGYSRYGPRKQGAEVERAASMKRALYDIIKVNKLPINTRMLKLTLGVQRMSVRETSIIASFYTNYDLGGEDLPRTDDIEKLRAAVGSKYQPAWYLHRDSSWTRFSSR